ncbi:Glutathione-regulated potassium-efflux system protein kefB [Georgfuchsia toluolica]|uniref:Glutathione-regulated potassium-efflux system protein kefB n=2 Tax=Georgfuchsia toluolica TaxID=424218 RepID=A0A916NI84_9PROT|nr:Glutathione-regulated potassium-efflux system protein kefB [Georgfuchsia toluolica]
MYGPEGGYDDGDYNNLPLLLRSMNTSLESVLFLLAAAVLVVAVFRSFNLPPVMGYLIVGAVIGPHALNLVADSAGTRQLAEFGVVFLMFSIGLEFSLARLHTMKRLVFGLGTVQVAATIAITMLITRFADFDWRAGLALGGALSMSSTAVLSRLLGDRLELESRHGREVVGVLLFQDLAVVPLLILVPAISQPGGEWLGALGLAVLKAAAVLGIVIFFGPRLMHGWFFMMARQKSSELFVLNVLFITLGLAWLTELAGLSLALGAFLAGMLISETEYRYRVEEDIKPFRDILLGLFFITIGMLLDLRVVLHNLPWVLLLLAGLLLVKLVLAGLLSRVLGSSSGTALRTGLWLCAGGEFGFVLLAQIRQLDLVTSELLQLVLAAVVLSLLLAPLIVHYSDRIVLRFVASEWLSRSMQLTEIAALSMGAEKHAILCGYGRTGQHLARFLDQSGISTIGLDLDPERVRDAALAGEAVSYGDCARRETLIAAGLARAHIVVITFADCEAALRVLSHVRELRPEIPVVARAAEERDVARLTAAGATEVVPEALESSIMLATHTQALLGIPMHKVIRRLREVREQQYGLLRGFFHGASDTGEHLSDDDQPRLHSIILGQGAHAIGKSMTELQLDALGCSISAIRRRGASGSRGMNEILIEGDVVVLLGVPTALTASEERLLTGK